MANLALDAGQTGIRGRLRVDNDIAEREFAGLLTDRELFPQLAVVVEEMLDGRSFPNESVTVSIGMTGLTVANSRPDELLAMLPNSVERVLLAHDSISGFLGSVGLGHGVMTAVGTGVVSLGVGPRGVARVDGWGNLIGDAGSAFWIGRAGLEAGMRAYDGRIESPGLLSLVVDNFTHPEEAYIDLQSDPNRIARIAGFARNVIHLASDDEHAASIVTSAGRELAHSAVTAARRVGVLDTASPRFSWAGNVMKADALRVAFIDGILAVAPHASIAPPVGEPIDGVVLLDQVAADSPLEPHVFISTR